MYICYFQKLKFCILITLLLSMKYSIGGKCSKNAQNYIFHNCSSTKNKFSQLLCAARNYFLINRVFPLPKFGGGNSFCDNSNSKFIKRTKLKVAGDTKMIHESTNSINLLANLKRIEVLEPPDKSESDRKEYRLIQLSNGLKVLLISDPSRPTGSDSDSSENSTDASETASASEDENDNNDELGESDDEDDNHEQLAACALTVDIGSFSDPLEIQGMAHFLEHMIFMGSEKYPTENEFDSFIKKSGGSDNADTDCEETSFYFEIPEPQLDGALERFSQLFTAPLLLREAMTREREAVESEFVSKMQGDDIRRDQLLAEMGQKGHPIQIFTWGNMKTLKDNIDDDKLYQQVNEFRLKYYSANRMYVAIQSRQSLDDLVNLAVVHFSDIQNNNEHGPNFSNFSHLNAFTSNFYTNVTYVKPVSDVIKLELTWPLPSYLKEYKCKPHHFIAYILGYEGRGSLCSYLRKQLWALEVVSGIDDSGFEHNSMYSLFSVTIYLTDQGYEHINDVLKATFYYINLLQLESLEDRFKELQTIEATTFKFMSEQDPIDNVEELVVNIKYYPPKHILTGPHLYYEYDETLISGVVKALNTRNFNVMISKQNIAGLVFDKKEKWFGTEYTTRMFPNEWINIWNAKDPVPQLFLPVPNKFISTDFSVLNSTGNGSQYPEKIFFDDCCELWYKQDEKFLQPKAFMYFYFISPLPAVNAANATLFNLYALILKYQLVDDLYAAEVAGLGYETYSAENGLVLKTHGYSEKLYLLVDIITKMVNTFLNNVTPEIFETFKNQLGKNYYNSIIKPKVLNKEIRLSIIENIHFANCEKYNLLPTLTLQDLKNFGNVFLNELKIVSIIQGNVTKSHAIDVINIVQKNIKCNKISDMTKINRRTVQLPIGDSYIRVKSITPQDVNTVITNFYQIGPSTIKLTSMLDLLIMLIEEPLFDMIRTKEQYGYDVSCSVRDNYSILGFTITINSQENKFHFDKVEKRIEKFRQEFLKILKQMPEIEFNHVKESLIKLNQIVDHKLKDEVVRNWSEVTTEEYIFDRREKEVAALKTLTQGEFIGFYEKLVLDSNENRKLSVQVIGENVTKILDSDCMTDNLPNMCNFEFIRLPQEKNNIENIVKFKENLFVYPLTKTTF